MAQGNNKAEIINKLCELLIDSKKEEGTNFVNENYPFIAIEKLHSRQYTKSEMMSVFLRDGFIDRYSGERLLFPGLIRLLTLEMPDVFKYHLNWKMSETHMIYWDLFPTVDHIVPIARGGNNSEDNWITTSQLRNSAKSNFTVEELGWEILPKGKIEEWDGLCSVFLKWVSNKNLEEKYFNTEDWKYITGWKEALIKTQKGSDKKYISNTIVNKKKENTNAMSENNDLKNFPVGTISRNKKYRNRYVTLKDEDGKLKYYSDSEDFCLKITTKPLTVEIEFAPEINTTSIVELPADIYNDEQLTFIKKACKKWCNGRYKSLSPKELPPNTIYQYLLKNS